MFTSRLGFTVASPNAELNGPCKLLASQPSPKQQSQPSEPANWGDNPTAAICFVFFIVVIIIFIYFWLFTPFPPSPSVSLAARRTSLPVLLFVPFRQPVGINGNVNTIKAISRKLYQNGHLLLGGGCRSVGGG